MLKKILKWTGITIGCLVILVLLFSATVYFKTESRANKTYTFKVQKLTIPTDSANYKLGAHVAAVRGCNDCHAGGGKAFFDDKNPIALLYSANLTNGKGGINYTDEDWLRALRHGIGKDGKTLWFMPVQHTSGNLSNKELAALISYLKQQPAVDIIHPKKSFNPLGRMLTFLDKFPMFTAEIIDHNASFPDEIKPEISKAYGQYMATVCTGCHGANLKGGPGHSPGEPLVPDISSTGNIKNWTSDQFITVLHTGKTPDGRMLTEFMPWNTLGKAQNDDELKAVYLYLHDFK